MDGGNPHSSINMSLINVTGNYVYASLGVMDNTGVFLLGSDFDPNDMYRLYLEEHPYPPSDWTYGNNFTSLLWRTARLRALKMWTATAPSPQTIC